MNQVAAHALAEIALELADISLLADVCAALESGTLSQFSGVVSRAAIAKGSTIADAVIRRLQTSWLGEAPELNGLAISVALRASAEAAELTRRQAAEFEVVWTGPKTENGHLRSTREVVRELLRSAQSELLIVGYWIAGKEDGVVHDLVGMLAGAMRRGVVVTFVVDERVRRDGADNLSVLRSLWPADVWPPQVLTWRLPVGDGHLKLHAKVVIADKKDALVTSANLTSYGLGRNMELGVRIRGVPAAAIAGHFQALSLRGTLESYEQSRS